MGDFDDKLAQLGVRIPRWARRLLPHLRGAILIARCLAAILGLLAVSVCALTYLISRG